MSNSDFIDFNSGARQGAVQPHGGGGLPLAQKGAPDGRCAPDVGAFFFEDTVEALARSGYRIGRVEFTAQPRQAAEAAALAGEVAAALAGIAAYAPLTDVVAAAAGAIPHGQYRVLRCAAAGFAPSGEPICDLLVTQAAARPADESGGTDGTDGTNDTKNTEGGI